MFKFCYKDVFFDEEKDEYTAFYTDIFERFNKIYTYDTELDVQHFEDDEHIITDLEDSCIRVGYISQLIFDLTILDVYDITLNVHIDARCIMSISPLLYSCEHFENFFDMLRYGYSDDIILEIRFVINPKSRPIFFQAHLITH